MLFIGIGTHIRVVELDQMSLSQHMNSLCELCELLAHILQSIQTHDFLKPYACLLRLLGYTIIVTRPNTVSLLAIKKQ